jgi:miniconductance mechanosensitive channel
MPGTASTLDIFVVLLLILAGAFVLDYFLRVVFMGVFRRMAARTKNQWDDLVVDTKMIDKLIHLLPALFVYILLPFAFSHEHALTLAWLRRLCVVYMIAVVLQFILAMLKFIHLVFHTKETYRNKPLKGFLQILQIITLFVGGILIISVLIDKSPTALFAGLGASAAVLMLVFKDSILGFVAGIQLSANDMLRAGDWITMPKYGVDGTVTEVNLTTVKVQNFDNTIVTLPPYMLVSDSFQNWRGMSESPGRRVKRSIFIDMNSVSFCNPEMLERFRHIGLLKDYIDQKEAELKLYNEENDVDCSMPVNGRRETNLGVFRAYLTRYLYNHPMVNTDLSCMVRHLQPTDKGLPVELYFFLKEKEWVAYEGWQADVFDHVLAVIPEFGLRVFQNVSGNDLHFQQRP